MKKLLAISLFCCCFGIEAMSQPSDSSFLQTAMVNYSSKFEVAQRSRMQLDAVTQKFIADSLSLTKDSTNRAEKAAALLLIKNTRDSLLQLAQAQAQEASVALDILQRQLGINQAYPTPNGNEIGIIIICIVCGFALLILILLSIAIRRQRFSLKDALSENAQEKQTILNPEYDADKLKAWLTSLNDDTLKSSKSKLDAAQDTLNQLLAKYPDVNTQTDTQKQEISNARQELDVAQAAFVAARNASTTGPGLALIASLARLFPPTIEVSSAGINIQLLNQYSLARQARIVEEVRQPADPQKLQTARLEEEATFRELSEMKSPEYRASTSRLIAFISAMLLITVGLASACFFFYFYLVNGVPPDLSRLPGVLIALGIGMAPYAVNKVAAAASKDKRI